MATRMKDMYVECFFAISRVVQPFSGARMGALFLSLFIYRLAIHSVGQRCM